MSGIPIVTLCLIALAGAESDERLRPDRDDYPIRESAVIARGSYAITDAEGNGAIRVAKLMPLSLTCDHRSVDGADAARCLAYIIDLLGRPDELLTPVRG